MTKLMGLMQSAVLATASALALASGASLAAQRTFVATWGNDASPCTRAQPCRDFQAAITAVDAGGEVVPLDSGSYSDMFINKSLSIVVPEGVHAGITVQGNYGILVTITASDRVLLRGLALNVMPPGNHGIVFNSPGTLEIESMTMNGPGDGSRNGIWVNGYYDGLAGGRRVLMTDTDIRGFSRGIKVGDAIGDGNDPVGWLEFEMRNSSVIGASQTGVDFWEFHWMEYVTIQGSVIADAGNNGLSANANALVNESGDSEIAIDDTMFVFNGAKGLLIQGAGRPRSTISGNLMTGNSAGVAFQATGSGQPNGFTRQDNGIAFDPAPYVEGLVIEPGK